MSLGLLAGSLVVGVAAPIAQAVAGNPGVPGTPTPIYVEDFENAPGQNLGVRDYVSASGESYSASDFWSSRSECNGFVTSMATPTNSTDCTVYDFGSEARRLSFQNTVRQMVSALAVLNGQDPTTNSGLAELANSKAPSGETLFQTAGRVPLSAANRFVAFSVNAAATTCGRAQANLAFFAVDDSGQEIPLTTSPLNPCTQGRVLAPNTTINTGPVYGGSLYSQGSILLKGSSLGLILRNSTASTDGNGNDFAIDDIKILDVTPQLDKSFSPASVPVGGVSTLTLTVTNTSDLAEKRGWQFTDTLPEGLVVAATPNLGGTCHADTSAQAGTSVIDVTNGVLAAKETSCTITVDVTSSSPRGGNTSTIGYQNCAANISNQVGINNPNCATVNFFSEPKLEIEKTSDAGQNARVGQTVTYEVRLTNTGSADFTNGLPAAFSDDLSQVLDDANWNDDAAVTFSAGSIGVPPTLAGTTLKWSGPLRESETATIRYSVTLADTGDGTVLNTACVPEAIAAGGGNCASTRTLIPLVSVTKTVDPTSGSRVEAGQVLRYTLTFANVGAADGVIAYTDRLFDVLDDGDVADGPVVSDAAVTAVRDGDHININGLLTPGSSVTVAYSVVVRPDGERGNNLVANVLADSPTPNPSCGDAGVYCTENPIGELETWKTVDPASGTSVRADETATYTLHFANSGKAPISVARDDVLSGVLDDADITENPVASSEALSVSVIADGRFAVAGELAAGQTVTISYTVKVRADGNRGDDQLSNFLVPQGQEPPATCDPASSERPNCTVNPVSDVLVSKTSDPESGATVKPGQVVNYTLTFTNRSKNAESAAAPLDYTDHMRDVLDDALLTGGPSSSGDRLLARFSGDAIRITGLLAPGETVVVTYSVQVKSYGEQGDHILGNVVAMTGDAPICVPGSGMCTTHDVPPPTSALASTGASALLGPWTGLAGLGLIVTGMLLLLRRKRVHPDRASESLTQ